MSELAQFKFGNSPLRCENEGGVLWFCASDICAAIDVTPEQVRRLDDDERGLRSTHTPGGMQQMAWVNEPGLYSLVLGSRKPEAKAFKRWVTHEVLPELRKTGTYSTKRARTISPEDERRKTLEHLAGLVDKAQDGALRDLLRGAAARVVDLLVPPEKATPTPSTTPMAIGNDLGWQPADFVAKASNLNASLVGKIASLIGLRDPRLEDRDLVRLSSQHLEKLQKDVPQWQYRGEVLALLIDACRAYASGEFANLAALAESQRFNAYRVIPS